MREENNISILQKDLEKIQNQLVNREKQKERIWNAYKITGDETEFRREITKLDNEVERLLESEAQYKALLSEAHNNEVSEQEYREACKTLTYNLAELDFDKKRLILKVLQIKVVIDGSNIQIYGSLPSVPSTANTLSR
jgi:DNA repair ATPase RecN